MGSPDTIALLEIPGVKLVRRLHTIQCCINGCYIQGRAKQLVAAGYKSMEDVAKADHKELGNSIPNLFPMQAMNMILSAKVCCTLCVCMHLADFCLITLQLDK